MLTSGFQQFFKTKYVLRQWEFPCMVLGERDLIENEGQNKMNYYIL